MWDSFVDNYGYNIRGVGAFETNLLNDSAVGVYLDGVYISRSTSTAYDVVDLERIEVLRGPQGTLFGQNSTGGAINVITKKPSFEKFGKISTSFGNYNSRIVKAYYTAPLSDTMAFSLNANTNQADGHAKNTVTGNDTNNRATRIRLT